MTTTADRLVDDYLGRLDRELADQPPERRRELTDEIAGHIAEARAGFDGETEADVRNLLDRLGDPADIAAESRERPAVPRRQVGAVEILALIALLVGGLILPFLGWFVGVVLLWVSQAWTTNEKLVGTLVVPGGLAPGVYIGLFGIVGTSCQTVEVDGRVVSDTCSDVTFLGTVWQIAVVILLVAPLATTIFLALKLRRPAPEPYQPSAGSA
jgi:hypothetical protein